MSLRIKIAKLLIRLGRFIQSSAVVVMRPDDLIEFNRQHYFKPNNIQVWCDDPFVSSGLTNQEKLLLDKIKLKKGRLLLLGLGGGREAISLAKMGFEVTGVDFVPQMVMGAKNNAEKYGLKISGLVQDISKLDLPEDTYDIAWLSAAMYSCVPTRKRRVGMLKNVFHTLKPGGYFVFEFLWNPQMRVSSKNMFLKKLIAGVTLGNLEYEKGDMLRFNNEFIHSFTSIDEVNDEILQAGFLFINIHANEGNKFAGAVVRKPG